MPIRSNEKAAESRRSYVWSVTNEDQLVSCIAELALGHYRHVRKVLMALSPQPIDAQKAATTRAIEELERNQPETVVNRDGWLFQFISWIALAVRVRGGILLRSPHMQPAQKGFDGIGIQMAGDNESVEFVLVSEDKATDNPRKTFRDDVIPEISDIDKGFRDSQLLADVTTLVEMQTTDEESRQRILEGALWRKDLRFRVSVATSEGKLPKKVDLFQGFSEAAEGNRGRRGGEVFVHPDLRCYLQDLSTKVVARLRSLAELESDV